MNNGGFGGGGFGGGKAMLGDPRSQKNPNNMTAAKKLDPKERRRVLLRLGKYMLRYKWMLLLGFVLMLSSNLLALLGPKLSGAAIDAIELGRGKVDFPTVNYYVILMAIFYAASALLSFALAVLGERVNVSARSKGKINVQLIMEKLGGGGHFDMAGASVAGTLNDAVERLLSAIDEYRMQYPEQFTNK